MTNYTKMARTAFIWHVVFQLTAYISFFVTGFVIVANYIQFYHKCMISVPAFLIGIGCAIFARIQDRKHSEYIYKARWG